MKKKELLIEASCALFILLMVYVASSKLIDFSTFRVELGKSPVLTLFAGYVAWFIPLVEIVIAMMLCFDKTRMSGIYAFVTLMTMFTAYIVMILNYSSYIPCSCGGALQNMNWTQHLWFNVGFVLLGCIVVLLYPEPKSKILKDDL
ncbi:MauE/DoxX family redox-associated membrane protein [Pedobacter nyackensis]|uniref:MauE/DoxX family redox-associated membrane protein n=1 Tax=Pedobacter nyackensis TaxID=475255 RepID=UPI002930EEAD|nr:MauE/DoxX family redox-associated membrane protein [Pedobacter nyackensis]